MAVLVDVGRASIASAVKNSIVHLAWGRGSDTWDTVPAAEDISATALVSEIGRRPASQIIYCLPAADGELIVPSGKFTASLTPTRHLFMRFNFDFLDSFTETIREAAVFIGTQKTPAAIAANKIYLTPGDIADPGYMLSLEHFSRLERSIKFRQMFEFVISF